MKPNNNYYNTEDISMFIKLIGVKDGDTVYYNPYQIKRIYVDKDGSTILDFGEFQIPLSEDIKEAVRFIESIAHTPEL